MQCLPPCQQPLTPQQRHHEQLQTQKTQRKHDTNRQQSNLEVLYEEIAQHLAEKKLQYDLVDEKVGQVELQILRIRQEREENRRNYLDTIDLHKRKKNNIQLNIMQILSRYKLKTLTSSTNVSEDSQNDKELPYSVYMEFTQKSFQEHPKIELPAFALAKNSQLCRHVHFLIMHTNQLYISTKQSQQMIKELENQSQNHIEGLNTMQDSLTNECSIIVSYIKYLQQQLQQSSPSLLSIDAAIEPTDTAAVEDGSEAAVLLRIRDTCFRKNKMHIVQAIDGILATERVIPLSSSNDADNSSSGRSGTTSSSSDKSSYETDSDSECDEDDLIDENISDSIHNNDEDINSQPSCEFDDVDIDDFENFIDHHDIACSLEENPSETIIQSNPSTAATNNDVPSDPMDSWFNKIMSKTVTFGRISEFQRESGTKKSVGFNSSLDKFNRSWQVGKL